MKTLTTIIAILTVTLALTVTLTPAFAGDLTTMIYKAQSTTIENGVILIKTGEEADPLLKFELEKVLITEIFPIHKVGSLISIHRIKDGVFNSSQGHFLLIKESDLRILKSVGKVYHTNSAYLDAGYMNLQQEHFYHLVIEKIPSELHFRGMGDEFLCDKDGEIIFDRQTATRESLRDLRGDLLSKYGIIMDAEIIGPRTVRLFFN